jgi:quercetin dioxygenase-like cupin family protein
MTTTDGESDAWPTEALVPTGKPYTDGRGTIHNLIEVSTGSTVLIDSKAGSVRANHFHKTDWHYCYLISGSMDYYHRAAGAPEPPERIVVRAGQMVFTPPMVEHAMKFLEDTLFITMSRNSRNHDAYEDDLVRVEVI